MHPSHACFDLWLHNCSIVFLFFAVPLNHRKVEEWIALLNVIAWSENLLHCCFLKYITMNFLSTFHRSDYLREMLKLLVRKKKKEIIARNAEVQPQFILYIHFKLWMSVSLRKLRIAIVSNKYLLLTSSPLSSTSWLQISCHFSLTQTSCGNDTLKMSYFILLLLLNRDSSSCYAVSECNENFSNIKMNKKLVKIKLFNSQQKNWNGFFCYHLQLKEEIKIVNNEMNIYLLEEITLTTAMNDWKVFHIKEEKLNHSVDFHSSLLTYFEHF